MQSRFRNEQIYDAVLDDESFAQLPSLLNQAYDA